MSRGWHGEPLYVLGGGFRHLDLMVDRRPDPRPETELVVESHAADEDAAGAVDPGTGSGAIACRLWPSCRSMVSACG